jgi:hypothetical protein
VNQDDLWGKIKKSTAGLRGCQEISDGEVSGIRFCLESAPPKKYFALSIAFHPLLNIITNHSH